MLKRAKATRSVIDDLMANEAYNFELSGSDWTHIDEVYAFLEPFNYATMRLQSDEITLDRTLRVLDYLHHHFKRSLKQYKGNNHELHTAILNSWHAFDKWYAAVDHTPIYAAAVLLHPERRLQNFKQHWPSHWLKPALCQKYALYGRQCTEACIQSLLQILHLRLQLGYRHLTYSMRRLLQLYNRVRNWTTSSKASSISRLLAQSINQSSAGGTSGELSTLTLQLWLLISCQSLLCQLSQSVYSQEQGVRSVGNEHH